MPLPLPNLDDRRWEDLVEEGRALVPFYAPDWTDHNASDPGITFIELLAWLAEIDVFRANQVPESHRLKFLSLVGVTPRPPRAARTVLAFALSRPSEVPLSGATTSAGSTNAARNPQVDLPAGLEFEGDDPFGRGTRYRLLQPISVVPARLQAVQVQTGTRHADMTARWNRGEPFAAFGDDSAPHSALILSFGEGAADAPLPVGVALRLWFTVQPDLAADEAERERLWQEQDEQAEACGPSDSLVQCTDRGGNERSTSTGKPPATWQSGSLVVVRPPGGRRERGLTRPTAARTPLAHHSARTVWEVEVGPGAWRRLNPSEGEVLDETRAFTLNGGVTIRLPEFLGRTQSGDPQQGPHHPHHLRRLRCRFVGGAFDAVPVLYDVAFNAVPAEQAAVPDAARESVSTKAGGRAEKVGTGNGWPWQRVALSEAPVVAASVRVYVVEGGRWRRWAVRPDFDASGRADRHCVVNAVSGEVTFGDGEHGRVVPDDAPIYVRYLATHAEQGNLDAATITRLAPSMVNQAMLGESYDALLRQFNELAKPEAATAPLKIQGKILVTNPLPACGGAAAETIVQAEGRALESVDQVGRAVTLADYEQLAKAAPGVRLARAHARANVHPAFPCFLAPGIISLVILPHLPKGRPVPSAALRQVVAAYVNRRRVIGTRVEVIGPSYTEVSVRAKVRAHAGASPSGLRQRIVDALNHFFDPLTGGPDSSGGATGTGWPFGRDVYRSEVLQVIDEVPGVDHVLALDLAADGGEPQCANLCLGAFGLVAAGEHRIEIVEGASA